MESFDGVEDAEVKVKSTNVYKATWCEQFWALLWRSYISNVRDPMIIRIKLSQTLVRRLFGTQVQANSFFFSLNRLLLYYSDWFIGTKNWTRKEL